MRLPNCHRSSGAVWWMRSEGVDLFCVKDGLVEIKGKPIWLNFENSTLVYHRVGLLMRRYSQMVTGAG